MSSTRLVLQKITRHTAGRYTCNALNSEGLSQSNAVHLRVKCKFFKDFDIYREGKLLLLLLLFLRWFLNFALNNYKCITART